MVFSYTDVTQAKPYEKANSFVISIQSIRYLIFRNVICVVFCINLGAYLLLAIMSAKH